MAGLDPAIHVFIAMLAKTWMPGTRPGMTVNGARRAAQPSAYISRSTTLASVAGRLMISSYMSIVTAQ